MGGSIFFNIQKRKVACIKMGLVWDGGKCEY